nr:hypothetical protein [Tanacetum cinerariifolium]
MEYIRLEEEKARRRGKVYNWETTTYVLLCEPTVSSLNDNKIDFTISFEESDDEDYADNDDDKFDIEHSSGDLSIKPLPDLIDTDVSSYAHGSNKLLETGDEYLYLSFFHVSWEFIAGGKGYQVRDFRELVVED